MPVDKSDKSRSGRSQRNRTLSARRSGSWSSSPLPNKDKVSSSRRCQHTSTSGRSSHRSSSRQSFNRAGGVSPPKQRVYIPVRSQQTPNKKASSLRSLRRPNREPQSSTSKLSERAVDDTHRVADADETDLEYSEFDNTQWERTKWKEQYDRHLEGKAPDSWSSKSATKTTEHNRNAVEASDVGTDLPGEGRQIVVEKGGHYLKLPIFSLALLFVEGVLALSGSVMMMSGGGYSINGQYAPLVNMVFVTMVAGGLIYFIFRRNHIETIEDEQGTTRRVKLVWKSLLLMTHVLRFGLTLTSTAIEYFYAACGDLRLNVGRACGTHEGFFYPAATLFALIGCLHGIHLFYVFFRRRFVVRRPCQD